MQPNSTHLEAKRPLPFVRPWLLATYLLAISIVAALLPPHVRLPTFAVMIALGEGFGCPEGHRSGHRPFVALGFGVRLCRTREDRRRANRLVECRDLASRRHDKTRVFLLSTKPTGRILCTMGPVTRILEQVGNGDAHAAELLLPLIYDELRLLAAQKLANEKPGYTLQATALVHEAYLRLVRPNGDAKWDGRRHFFGAAAEAMRRILVERARRNQTAKHGGEFRRRDLDAVAVAAPEPNVDLIALDAALIRLAEHDPAKAKLVELRYFAGLTGDEAAEVLGVSPSTVDREWIYTRAWLRREIGQQP